MAHGAFLFEQLWELSEWRRRLDSQRGVGAASWEQSTSSAGSGRGEGSEQLIAAEIIARRTRGDSFGAIARELNRRGHAGRYGGRWYGASVRHYFRKFCDGNVAIPLPMGGGGSVLVM